MNRLSLTLSDINVKIITLKLLLPKICQGWPEIHKAITQGCHVQTTSVCSSPKQAHWCHQIVWFNPQMSFWVLQCFGSPLLRSLILLQKLSALSRTRSDMKDDFVCLLVTRKPWSIAVAVTLWQFVTAPSANESRDPLLISTALHYIVHIYIVPYYIHKYRGSSKKERYFLGMFP